METRSRRQNVSHLILLRWMQRQFTIFSFAVIISLVCNDLPARSAYAQSAPTPISTPAAASTPTSTATPTPTLLPTIIFDQGDRALCRVEPGWLTVRGSVTGLEPGRQALLQSNWYVVNPADERTQPVYQYHGLLQNGERFAISVYWPGLRPGETQVSTFVGLMLLDPLSLNPLMRHGASVSFYWYPWVCPAPTETATPSPTSTLAPTETATGTPTETASPTPTGSPTDTPTATTTSTASPTPIPTAGPPSPTPSLPPTTTPTDTAPPTTPENLHVTGVSDTAIGLAWDTAFDDVGVVAYDVISGTAVLGSSTDTSLSLSGLQPGTTYVLSVAARDAAGNRSQPSEPITATTTLVAPPLAASTILTTSEDLPLSFDLASLLNDLDGGALTLTLAALPQHGAASLLGTTLTYTPTANYYGSDTLTYQLQDARGRQADALVSLVVEPIDDAPVVSLDASPLTGTLPLSVTFAARASDVEGDLLTYTWSFGDGASVSGGPNITHVYTQTGFFTARLTVDDHQGGRVSRLATITVADPSGNLPPQARTGGLLWEPASASGTLDLATIASDANGDALRFSLVEQPKLGSATLSGSVLTYDATGIYTDTAEIRYRVDDGRGGSAEGIVRTSRPDLVPEGNVVAGPDGVAVGAATGVVTAPVALSITLALSMPAALPAGFVPRGAAYAIRALTDTLADGSQQPLLVGLPALANVPTDSLALAVYTPQTGTTEKAGEWSIHIGFYDAQHNLYINKMQHINRIGTYVSIVSLSTYAPLQQTISVIDTNKSIPFAYRNISSSTSINQSSNHKIALLYRVPRSTIGSSKMKNQLIRGYEQLIPKVIQWYEYLEFHSPKFITIPSEDIPSENVITMFPSPNTSSDLYEVIYFHPKGDGVCSGLDGKYEPESREILLCYTSSAKQLEENDIVTVVHEFAHGVQFAYTSIAQKGYVSENSFFLEGTATLFEKTYMNNPDITSPPALPARQTQYFGQKIFQSLDAYVDIHSVKSGEQIYQYETQDFWLYWLSKYGNKNIANLKQLFNSTDGTVESINTAFGGLNGTSLKNFYWKWIRDYAFENWSYLYNKTDQNCWINITGTTPLPNILQPDGIEVKNPAFSTTQKTASYTLVNPVNALSGWLVSIKVHNPSTNAVVKVRVKNKANTSDLRAALYTENAKVGFCSPGDIPNLNGTINVSSGDSYIDVLIANVDFFSRFTERSIDITLETQPDPKDDNYTVPNPDEPKAPITLKPGQEETLSNLLANDLPKEGSDTLIISSVKPSAGFAGITEGGKAVRYKAPLGLGTDDCEGSTVPIGFTYRVKYKDGEESANEATVTMLMQKNKLPICTIPGIPAPTKKRVRPAEKDKEFDLDIVKIVVAAIVVGVITYVLARLLAPLLLRLGPKLMALRAAPAAIALADGDPHLTTFDGLGHSPQTLGEFVYVQPVLTSTLTIQARHGHIDGFAPWTSFITATAVRADKTTFEVRLPPAGLMGTPLELLINGKPVDLAPGMYLFDGALLRVEPGNEVTIYTADGGIVTAARPEDIISVRIGKFADSSLFGSYSSEQAAGLRIEASMPLNGNARGLLGTPNGTTTDDLVLPDGQRPANYDQFTEAWRITDPARSLFTYAPGQGPQTFNREQTAPLPTREDLLGLTGGPNYVQHAQDLLLNRCRADVSAVDEVYLTNLALELAAGRSETSLVASGVCVDDAVALAGKQAAAGAGLLARGQLALANHPEIGLAGARVVVSSPTLGQVLCDTTTASDGSFSCGRVIEPISTTTTLELRYRITGRGAPIEQTFSITAPQPGRVTVDQRFFSASVDRVLRLSGRVLDPAGVPIPGALVQVREPQRLWTTASPSGTYTLDYPLPDGMAQVALVYEAVDPARTSSVAVTAQLRLEQHGLVPLARDLITERRPPPQDDQPLGTPARYLLVGGTLTNALVPDQPVPLSGMRTDVRGPGLRGGGCTAVTSPDGFYQCEADLLPTFSDTLPLTVTFSGAGALTRTLSIPAAELPALDNDGAVVRLVDAALPATTLVLTGTLSGAGRGLAGATVEVSDPVSGTRASGRTGSDGSYQIALSLPDTALGDNGRATLVYRATFTALDGSSTSEAIATASGVRLHQITHVRQDLTFTARTIAFTGRVRNDRVPELPGVPGARVQISSPARGALCDVRSDREGLYHCDVSIEDDAPFSVVYQISERGSFTSDLLPVDPAGLPINGRLPVSRSFTVSPTTLQVQGRVLDTRGQTQADVLVGASFAEASAGGRTAPDGSYLLYLALPDGAQPGELALSAYYAGDLVSLRADTHRALGEAPAGLTPVSAPDLTLDGAFLDPAQAGKIHLRGIVGNQTEPEADMSGLTVRISAEQYGELCLVTTGSGGSYDCPERVLPSSGALTLTYDLIGYTDPQTRSVAVQPGTQTNELPFTLLARLATLQAQGRVTLPGGAAAGRLAVAFTGALDASTQTDEQGDYRLVRPVPLGALSGVLTTTVQGTYDRQSVGQAYRAGPGDLILLAPLALLLREPRLALAPPSIEASLAAGTSGAATLMLSNTGTFTLSLALTVNDLAAHPWVQPAASALTLAPGQSNALTVGLDATALISGTYQADIRLTSNDPSQPQTVLPVTLHVTGTPRLAVTPDTLDFGTQFLGQTVTRTVTLHNSGSAVVQLSSITSTLGDVQVGAAPQTLAPAQSGTLVVRFTPGHLGEQRGFIEIVGNHGRSSIPVSGAGQEMPGLIFDPVSLSQTLSAGTQLTRTLAITNTGLGPLTWTIGAERPLERVRASLDAGTQPVLAAIPNRYLFSGGESGWSICCTGYNRSSSGNVNQIRIDGNAVPYSNDAVITDTGLFGGSYFTRKYDGLFVLVADLQGRYRFDINGYLGSDTWSQVGGAVLRTRVGGRAYLGFVKRVSRGSDPSVSHLIIVPEQEGLSQSFSQNPSSDDQTIEGLRGADRLYYLAYAQEGRPLDDTATLALMRAFVTSLGPDGWAAPGQWLHTSPLTGTLEAGQSGNIALGLDATGLLSGTYRASLGLSSNDPQRPAASLPVTLTVQGAPALELPLGPLELGSIPLGQTVTRTLALTNTGTADLEISVSSNRPDVQVQERQHVLTPAEEYTLVVQITPSQVGSLDGVLTIRSALGERTLPFSGTGQAAPALSFSPASISQTIAAGGVLTRTVVLTNTGGGDLAWSLSPAQTRLASVKSLLDQRFQTLLKELPPTWSLSGDAAGTQIGGTNRLSTNLGGPLPYTNGVITSSLAFGGASYFTRFYPGLFVLAADLNGVESFQINGTLSDCCDVTDGWVASSVISTTVGGRTFLGLTSQVNNTGSQVRHLIIVEQHPGVTQDSSTDYRSDDHTISGLSSVNRLYDLFYWGYSTTADTDGDLLKLMRAFLLAVEPQGWVTPSTSGGVLAPSAQQTLDLRLDATELSGGSYGLDLDLTSGDPARPRATLPLTLTVTEPQPRLAVSTTPIRLSLGAGSVGSATLTLTNTGTADLHWSARAASSSRKPTVAVLGADRTYSYDDYGNPTSRVAQIAQQLQATGQFSQVDAIDIFSVTPTLALLQQYDSVLLYAEDAVRNPDRLGDVLADYVDRGGGVVQMQWTLDSNPERPGTRIGGRFGGGDYGVLATSGSETYRASELGEISQPDHPLVQGVTSVRSSGSTVSWPITGSVVLARYDDQVPLAAERKLLRNGLLRTRVDLNLRAVSGDWRHPLWDQSSGAVRLMANALRYVVTPDFLRATSGSGTLAPGTSQTITLTLDTTRLPAGDTMAEAEITSDDPNRQRIAVPVTIHVVPAP